MSALDAAHRYFAAWNAHDPDGIAASLHPDGRYADPNVPDGLPPQGLAQYAAGLFAGFPDLRFELVSHAEAGPATVVAQWRMVGTNAGSMRGNPPTGRSVDLPGADVVTVEGDRVRHVQGYFDRQTMLEQLGLTVVAQPEAMGPFSFGVSVAVRGPGVVPGAIGVTSLILRSEADVPEVLAFSRPLAAQLPEQEGFVGWQGATVGGRMTTLSAFETVDQLTAAMRHPVHRDAARKMYTEDWTEGGLTSVWAPVRVAFHQRCPSCREIADRQRTGATCSCGAALPDPPPYL